MYENLMFAVADSLIVVQCYKDVSLKGETTPPPFVVEA